MLYKYLFYGISYYVKKYDNLWNVGETYYVGGGLYLSVWLLIHYFLISTVYWEYYGCRNC